MHSLQLNQKHFMQKAPVKIVFFIILLFSFSNLFARQNHFIYIENEDRQPFSVSVVGKIYSSSETGHIIISKLTNGKYHLTINFPQNKFPSQTFTCLLDKKDLGFSLKNIPSKGWALVDMDTKKINLSNNATAGNELADLQSNNSGAFGDMLSQVVNDSALVKNNTLPEPEIKNEIQPEIKKETEEDKSLQASIDSAVKLIDAADKLNEVASNTIVADTAVFIAPVIVPDISENAVTEKPILNIDSSISTIKEDVSAEIKNTVPETETFISPDSANTETSNPFFQKKTETTADVNTTVNNTEKENAEIVQPQQEEVKQSPAVNNDQPITNAVTAYKPDCKGLVEDNDLGKIKRKMFVQNSNNEMVQTGIKLIGDKCLTTEQVKTLGGLFLSDDGRYTLYDALYNYVYDKSNYANLENQIIDPYYRKRFEAMLLQ